MMRAFVEQEVCQDVGRAVRSLSPQTLISRRAGGKDVALGGGANVAQQYLAAGLIEEMEIHLVPLLLGGGTRLFERLAGSDVKLEPLRTLDGPGVTHLRYRIVK